MSLSIGIVGLPNVGKSTLFTALTRKGAVASNHPFATIEPNVGAAPIPFCAKIESEMAELTTDELAEYLEMEGPAELGFRFNV